MQNPSTLRITMEMHLLKVEDPLNLVYFWVSKEWHKIIYLAKSG